MLDPVTFYNSESNCREVNISLYKQRILNDSNLENKGRLIEYGNNIFNDLIKTIDINESKTSTHSIINPAKSVFSKLRNVTFLGTEEAEFYMKFIPHNGMLSMRRGYYKLLPTPDLDLNSKIEKWQTDVLFNEGRPHDKTYKYKCNVGVLVNSLAIVGDLSLNKFCDQRDQMQKRKVLESVLDKVIYISSAELVIHADFNSTAKEVLWFKW